MTVHRLQRTQLVPAPVEAVAPFFEAPENLALITPPWMRFRIVTPGPIAMRTGARIDYTLRILGLPLSWRTLITEFEPGRRFVDQQERGPYRLWRHLHEFEPVEGGTLVRDTVDYEVPLGPLGELARRLYVARTLERIFDHRAATIRALDLARPAAPGPLG
jgi:ligand-binding SRPBCC domain-containing protein